MARRPTLSPTKASVYLACPVKYKWSFVDPRGKWYMRPKRAYSFGTSLHAALERFHDEGDQGVNDAETLVVALEEGWVSAGYRSVEEANESLAEGRQILRSYVQTEVARPQGVKSIFIEKMVKADMGRFVLQGRVDRVDEHPDGTLEIVDYKSGRSAVTPERVKGEIGMQLYAVMVREMRPGRPIRITIIALRPNERASVDLTDEEIADTREAALALGEEILDRDFENIEPVAKRLCLDCEFLPLCRSHREFAENLRTISATLAATSDGVGASEGGDHGSPDPSANHAR